jgi:hypothetical protein
VVPSIGRIVHYRLSESDAARAVARRRQHPAFGGNTPRARDVYPMMITRVWSENPTETDCVQGQVFLDGNDSLWVTSVQQQGHTYDPTVIEGVWFEPPRI